MGRRPVGIALGGFAGHLDKAQPVVQGAGRGIGIAHHQRGQIEYIPFPEHLKGRYQSYTQADMGALRAAGYSAPFQDVAQGVRSYMAWLQARGL